MKRILGDSAFVDRILQMAEDKLSRREKFARQGWDVERLASEVCARFAVTPDDLRKKGRDNAIATAKSLFCYWGKEELGVNGADFLAAYLGMSRPAVTQAVRKGELIVAEKCLKLLS